MKQLELDLIPASELDREEIDSDFQTFCELINEEEEKRLLDKEKRISIIEDKLNINQRKEEK